MFDKTYLNIFYNEILSRLENVYFFPCYIEEFLFNPLFDNDQFSIKRYNPIFNEIENICKYSGDTYFVCDSSDIDEGIEFGDYDYIIGYLNNDCPFLYQLSSEPFAMIPNRLILYDPKYQIEIDSSKPNIEVYEVNKSVRDLFYIDIFDEKVKAIKNMLKNSDRPLLFFKED